MKVPNLLSDVRHYFDKEPMHIRHEILKIMIEYCRHKKFYSLPNHEKKKQLRRKLETKIKRRKQYGLYKKPIETSRSDISIPVDPCDQDYLDLEVKHPSKTELKELLISTCENTSKKTITKYFIFLRDNYKQDIYVPFSGWLEEDRGDLPF